MKTVTALVGAKARSRLKGEDPTFHRRDYRGL